VAPEQVPDDRHENPSGLPDDHPRLEEARLRAEKEREQGQGEHEDGS